MNESTEKQTEFVLRRLSDSFQIGGNEVSAAAWVIVLALILVVGLVYVVWMYRRDCRTIAWPWAVLLGLLRTGVYFTIAGVFLLPAWQTWETAEKRSRVVLVLDVSPSVAAVSDDLPPEDGAAVKPLTRLDRVIQFLGDDKNAFVKRLTEKNPVFAYRFGSRLDEDYHVFEKDQRVWDAAAWQAWLHMDFKKWLLRGLSDEGQALVTGSPAFDADKPGTDEWAAGWLRKPVDETIPAGLNETDQSRLVENRKKLDKRLETVRQLQIGTDVGESVLAVLNREANNMVQGVIVVSDGRSTQGSESAVAELRARAKKDNVPVFTVLVGEDRQPIDIRITDVQTPEQAPPNEKFVVRAELDGVGLPDQEVKVLLDIFKPDAEAPTHTLEATARFQPGEPPHAQAEFAIDPDQKDQLPGDLFGEAGASKEFVEGEWKFRVRVARDRRETFPGKEHVSDFATVQIIKKPRRVLLVASGPLHDYQFVRTLLVREKDQKRAEVSVFLQNEGRDGRAVQDVEPERLLNRFPSALSVEDDPNERAEDRYYNLARYDLIVLFDPDWSEFQPEQLLLLQKWVDTQAGGLIYVAGPVNTFQLARGDDSGRLKPILDLIPVVPGDSVLMAGPVKRSTKSPWRLNFAGASPDMDFLKLDDDSKDPLAGWNEFFFGKDGKAESTPARGFYNFYPIKSVKPGATVVATFTDPLARMPDGKEHPFLVAQPFGKGRVVFVGSGEVRRLRQYKELYYERFWMKLGRYASAGSRTRQNRRGVLVMGRQFTAGNYVRLEAQLFGPTLEPLAKSTKPKLTIATADGTERREYEMSAKPSQSDWAGWFQARVLAGKPGDYQLELPIPGSGDILRGKFSVKASNPELDNARPDPAALYQMAGDIDEVQPRLAGKDVYDDLKARLQGGRPSGADKSEAGTRADSPKLFFTLSTADMIAACMTAERKEQRNRGPVDDVWDDGPAFGTTEEGKPREVATLLMVLVGLLSLEWLGRKLLRLA